MCDAVLVRVRYDSPDENGQTRRERNEAFGEVPPPPMIVPPIGRYLWDWYFGFSDRVRRVRDGVCEPLPPSEFLAWCTLTGAIVYPFEYEILCAMDLAFCNEMNKELAAYRERIKNAKD